MPAPSSIQPRLAPTAGDVFLELHRMRDGEPEVTVTFGPADYVDAAGAVVAEAAAAALNAAGQPMVRRWPGAEYTLHVSMRTPAGAQRIGVLMARVDALCAAGKSIDDAEATAVYELLDQVRAAGSREAALDTLGVEVGGVGDPFIPTAPSAP